MLQKYEYQQEIAVCKEHCHFCPSDKVSIVIVGYNTNKLLLNCLDSLKDQSWQEFEIILVDNGKNDRIEELLPKYSIKYIKLRRNMGVSYGRNLGAVESNGRILAFLDDDCVVHEDYAKNLWKVFQKEYIYGLRGKISFRSTTVYNFLQQHYDLGDETVPYFINVEGNCAVRREHLFAIGGWDETLWGHEGVELSYRLVNRFGRRGLIYYPDLVIFHDYADSFKKLVRKCIRHDEMCQSLNRRQPYFEDFISSYPVLKSECHRASTFEKVRLRLIQALLSQISGRSLIRAMAKVFLKA